MSSIGEMLEAGELDIDEEDVEKAKKRARRDKTKYGSLIGDDK